MRQILLTMILAGAAISAQAQVTGLYPILNCVEDSTGGLVAYVGYVNLNPEPTMVPYGAINYMSPPPSTRSQPTLFQPGVHDRVFSLTLAPGQSVTWFLAGQPQFVGAGSIRCGESRTFLPPATLRVPYTQRLATMGSTASVSWSSLALPAGLSLSSDGVLSGTPTTVGTQWVVVDVSGVKRSYSLTVHDVLTVDDTKLQPPQGLGSAGIRTVTNVSGTISSTAACLDTEIVIGGGGACSVPNSNALSGRVATSQPVQNGWTTVCSNGVATAIALCAAK